MKKKIVYIAHPLNAPTEEERRQNLRTASEIAARFAQELDVAPICTWITLASVWSDDQRGLGLEIDKRLIEVCQELWICGTASKPSPGMQIEIDYAISLEILVRDMRFAHLYEKCGNGSIWMP